LKTNLRLLEAHYPQFSILDVDARLKKQAGTPKAFADLYVDATHFKAPG
jgi:hypothetical protein